MPRSPCSLLGADWPAATGLSRRQAAVAADVAVLAADDHVDGVIGAGVEELADGRGVDAGEAAGAEAVAAAVSELDLDRPGVDEVEVLLLVVEGASSVVARGKDYRVDPERANAEREANLAEAVAFSD